MAFKCKHCNWKLPENSYYDITADFMKINDHINNCPVKPFGKTLEEKWKKARKEK